MRRGGATPDAREAAVRALRLARRHRYRTRLDWADAIYRAYVVALLGIVATLLVSGALGDARADAATVRWISDHGPALAGCLVALAAAAAVRSGGRGGPLALEAPDVHHLLLAPVRRGVVLRPLAARQLRTVAFAGAVVGAVAGNLAFRRLPGRPVAWVVAGACAGLLVAAAWQGAALCASGRRLAQWQCTAIAAVLLLWSAADVALGGRTSPATMAGRVALLPLDHGGGAWLSAGAGVVIVGAVLAAGLASVAGTSLEASLRRAQLAAVLRFSVTLGDVRAVVLLRRQLAGEMPRARPWVRLGASARRPVLSRAWRSYARWPMGRVGRIVVLALLAGAATAGEWRGTTPLVVVAGCALLLAALDAIEPFAEEADHASRARMIPVAAPLLARRHLPAPLAAMGVVSAIGAVVAILLGGFGHDAAVPVLAGASAAVAATLGAALSVTVDPLDWVAMPTMQYGLAAAPFVAAIAGGLPVLAARLARDAHRPAVAVAVDATFVLVLACLALAAYVARSFAKRTEPV